MGKVVLSSEEATWVPAASLHLAAHPSASPHAAGPAPGVLQAPISLTVSSHPSRPPSCALTRVTSPPLSPGASSLDQGPGSHVHHGVQCLLSYSSLDNRLLQEASQPPPPGSLPAVPKGMSHAFPGPQDSGAPSICSSAHPVCLSLPLAMMFLAPSSLLSVTWPTHLGRTRCGPGHPRRPRPQGWAAPASGERPAQGSRAAAGPHAAATQSLP